jgi:hypothetical protein
MSSIGSPADLSILQAAQAQQVASKSRDREKAASDSGRRYQDLLELRVAGLETAAALRKLPSNDSEQAESEHDAQNLPQKYRADDEGADPERPHIDVKA